MRIKTVNETPDSDKKSKTSDVLAIDNDDVKPSLERIVWFFNDGSFKEYSPGR